jgi:hypothetical protein
MTCSNENQQRNAGKMRVVWRIEKRKGHATPGLIFISSHLPSLPSRGKWLKGEVFTQNRKTEKQNIEKRKDNGII